MVKLIKVFIANWDPAESIVVPGGSAGEFVIATRQEERAKDYWAIAVEGFRTEEEAHAYLEEAKLRQVWSQKLNPKKLPEITKFEGRKYREASQRVCVCGEHAQDEYIVRLGTVDIRPHELETLDEFYCMQCNSFWREP